MQPLADWWYGGVSYDGEAGVLIWIMGLRQNGINTGVLADKDAVI